MSSPRRVCADFNCETEEGEYVLNTAGSLESIALGELRDGELRDGERVVLSDGEVETDAVVREEGGVWVALPVGSWRDVVSVVSEGDRGS